jgi:hypothetical protein
MAPVMLNLVILYDLIHGAENWGNYFFMNYVPRLITNLSSLPIRRFIFPPITAEKIFVSLYILLLGTAIPYFIYIFNKQPTLSS